MRIFIGTTEIGGQIPLYAEGFRALGHQVTTGVNVGHCYKFDPSLTYDLAVDLNSYSQAASIIDAHDVFLFQFGQSLLHGNADFPAIRRAGKKIISLFNGSDVRYWPLYEQQFNVDYRTLSGEEPPEFWSTASLPSVLSTLRRGELYADLILSVPNQSVLGLRPYNHFFYVADLSRYRFHVPDREVPVVVHAPSQMQTKGTARILAALDRLKAEGVAFELRLLHNVSNSEVRDALADADCVIDQIYLGYGFFATEGMASGCAASTGHFPQLEAFASRRPIHPLRISNIENDLRILLTDRELRVRLAHEGRAHVEKFHDHVRVCHRILEDLENGEDRIHDYYPRYYACEAVLPKNVHIPQNLLKISSDIVTRYGLPHDANPLDMVLRGLLSPHVLTQRIPRWDAGVQDGSRFAPISGTERASRPMSVMMDVPEAKGKNCSEMVVASRWALPLLEAVRGLDLVRLCLSDVLPLAVTQSLQRSLALGALEEATLALYNFMESTGQEPPPCRAALGLLLLGCQMQGAGSMLHSAVVEALRQMHSDEAEAVIPAWVSVSLWLAGEYYLERKDMRTALPLLEAALDGIRPRINSLGAVPMVYIDTGVQMTAGDPAPVPEDTALAICWDRPAHLPQNCHWISPAALTPDWWCMPHRAPLWHLIMFITLQQGYALHPVHGGNRTTALLHTITETHITAQKNAHEQI